MKSLAWVAATGVLAILSQSADATALAATGVSCSGHATAMTSQPGYELCSGAWSGNNLNQSAAVTAQILADFGLSGLTAPIDITGSSSGGSGVLSLGSTQTGEFVISLKAGDAFSLYEFDGSAVAGGISSINFDTLGVGFITNGGPKFGQDLSHADLYGGPNTPPAVPEPASLGLLGLGLAGLGLARRKRKS